MPAQSATCLSHFIMTDMSNVCATDVCSCPGILLPCPSSLSFSCGPGCHVCSAAPCNATLKLLPPLAMRAWPSCRRFLVLLLLVFLFLFLFRLLGLLHRHLLLLLLGLLHLFGLLLDLLQRRLRLGFILGSLRCRLLCDLSD